MTVSHLVEIRRPPPGYGCYQYRIDGGYWEISSALPGFLGRWSTRRAARRHCRSMHDPAAIERWTWSAEITAPERVS